MKVFFLLFFFLYIAPLQAQENVREWRDSFVISLDFVLYDTKMSRKQIWAYNEKIRPIGERMREAREQTPLRGLGYAEKLDENIWIEAEQRDQEFENCIKQYAVSKQVWYFDFHFSGVKGYIYDDKDTIPLKTKNGTYWDLDTVTCLLPQVEKNDPFSFVIQIDSFTTTYDEPSFAHTIDKKSLHFKLYRQGFTNGADNLYYIKDGTQRHELYHKRDTCGWLGRIDLEFFMVTVFTQIRPGYPYGTTTSSVQYLNPTQDYLLPSHDDLTTLYKKVNPVLQYLKTGIWENTDTHRIIFLYTNQGLTHLSKSIYRKKQEFLQLQQGEK